MAAVEPELAVDEYILYRGRVTLWAMFPWFILGTVIGWFTCGAGLLLIPAVFFRLSTNETVITSKKLIVRTGLVQHDTVVIPAFKVSGLSVRQGICGRFMGFGTLIISHTEAADITVRYVKDPAEFSRRFFDIRKDVVGQQEGTKTVSVHYTVDDHHPDNMSD